MIDIEYVASARARSVRITVERGGDVRVTYPRRISRARVIEWVQSRSIWISNAQKKMSMRGGVALPRGSEGRALFLKQKKSARELVERILSEYNTFFSWKKVRIVNAKTRWGSCSTRGTLSFNWRIVYLTDDALHYLIVHELCHLVHHNHSPQFWEEVARFCPEYKIHRRTLKGYHF